MANSKKNKSQYEFVGLPVYDIIGKPLIAIARAQSMMAKEQLKSMMETCFRFNGKVYEPIQLKMVVTRSVLEPSRNPHGEPRIKHITTAFYLPLITIFPFNSLGIENVDLDFTIEISSQYGSESMEEEDEEDSPFSTGNFSKKLPKLEMMGRISTGVSQSSESETEKSKNKEHSSSMHINVEAGTLPLTKGLLELINIYSNSISVSDAKEPDQLS